MVTLNLTKIYNLDKYDKKNNLITFTTVANCDWSINRILLRLHQFLLWIGKYDLEKTIPIQYG